MSSRVAGGPTTLEIPADAGRFFRHGWHSWSPAGWVERNRRPRPISRLDYRLTADDPEHVFDSILGGSWMGAVELEDGRVRLLGALDWDARVTLFPGALAGDGGGDWFSADGPEDEVFGAYAAELARRHGARTGSPGAVWCSWYGYYGNISHDLLSATVGGLGDLGFSVFQVDDGWQQAIGDWQPNRRFGAGMAAVADGIRASGRRAGLWLAPFVAHADSALAQQQPQMLLRDAAGTPVVAARNWGGDAYALDVTRPDVRDLTAATVRRARTWGFDYLKLDFLFAGALAGAHHRPTGREAAYRAAVEAIRAAAGDDAYLLACGAPIVPSLGVFDALRVGPDVGPEWEDEHRVQTLFDLSGPGARNAIVTSLHRLWLAPLIATDPDVVFFRSRDSDLTADQRRLLQDLARVAGFVGCSDPPDWLTPAERTELAAFLGDAPAVDRTGRYAYRIGERAVDFAPVVAGP